METRLSIKVKASAVFICCGSFEAFSLKISMPWTDVVCTLNKYDIQIRRHPLGLDDMNRFGVVIEIKTNLIYENRYNLSKFSEFYSI